MKQENGGKRRNTGLLAIIVMFALALAFSATLVFAAPVAPTALSQVSSTSRDLTQLQAQSASAQGGNVTEININTLTITNSWQGYYGNVTGAVILADALNNTFYNWSMTNFSGRVYATRASSVNWALINCSNATATAQEESYLNQSPTDSDSVVNTFNQLSHPSFTVGVTTIPANTCPSTHGYVNNASQGSSFAMVLLNAGANTPVYATIMNQSAVGFDGRKHDFELLVGENQKPGYLGVTPYYFWTEFN